MWWFHPAYFADLVVVHAELGFGFLEALFYGPTDAAEPDKGLQTRAHRGALLMKYEYFGSSPRLRLMTSHTFRSGIPFLHNVTRLLVNS